MRQHRMFVSKSMQRLLQLFQQIEDNDVRIIIAEAVILESKHRSSSMKNFPIRDLRDIVDSTARIREAPHREVGS
jgi:hypothetical protein